MDVLSNSAIFLWVHSKDPIVPGRTPTSRQNLFFIFPTQAHPALSEYEQLQQRNIRQRKDVFDAMFQAKQELNDTKSEKKAWNYIFSPVVIFTCCYCCQALTIHICRYCMAQTVWTFDFKPKRFKRIG